MVDTAASVLARLKNKGKETGRSYQLCLQLFCQEEFLRRLEKSQYAENLVLKGGLFIYSITGFDSRVTVDVDFLLRKVPNTPEKLKKVLRSILTEYPAGVYNQDTPMGYLKERGDRHGRMLLPEDQGPHGRRIQEPDEPAEPDRGPDPRPEGHAGEKRLLP